MKKKLLLVLLATSISLFGCGKEEVPKSNLPTSVDAGNFDIVMETVNSVPEEVSATSDRTKIVLDVNGREFYNVYVPSGTNFVTDYSKYVYGEDPKFTISVLSGVSDTNFGNSVGVVNAENVTQNVVRSKPGQKGPQQCAILLSENRAVVANCYSCPEVFATIFNGMVNSNPDTYTVNGVSYVEEVTYLSSLSYNGGYEKSAIDKTEVGKTCLYKYDDGGLYVSTELRRFDECKEFMLTKLNIVSGQSVSTVYSSGNIYYAKAGNFHLALYQENFNTTIVLFGNGDEALCNIIFLLEQITDK